MEETDVKNYTVQKSEKNLFFVDVATAGSKGNGQKKCAFSDKKNLSGTRFYRIKQTEYSGRIGYSAIIKIAAETDNNIVAMTSIFTNGFVLKTT